MELNAADAWTEATRRALEQLWAEAERGDFYYVVFATTDALDFPGMSAWSHAALRSRAIELRQTEDDLRFSYADSPYLDFASPFTRSLRPAWDAEVLRERELPLSDPGLVETRLAVLVATLRRLREGGFLDESVLVNVECGWADRERAVSLNAPSALLARYTGR